MSGQDVENLRRAYHGFNVGKPDTALGMMDKNVEWTEPGGGNAPSGTFNSPQEVGEKVFGPIAASFDEFVVTPENFDDQGDKVIVTGRMSGKNKSGADLDAAFTQTFEMADGKIKRFNHDVDDGWVAGWS
jgi:ketosteroid isomerase-like protein